ncbi:hypothetical protein VaNZ11_003475 [Volvox africanus]|uniref:RAP domain-containing protein n=1 Tax=Volvox africanus TaxID=51714 RepID=A0ABQ5RVE8_9CHLO|nr:hypothetical protein VaNZ11_003475 [Volvox africanus]
MVRECLSRYAASSKARAFRTSLICANPGTECLLSARILEERIPGVLSSAQPSGCRCSDEAYPRASRRWRGCAATRRTANLSLQKARLTPDGTASAGQAREQEGMATDTAPPTAKPSWQVAAVCPPNTETNCTADIESTAQKIVPLYSAEDGMTARQITQLITRAQTWADLATITCQCGGASALNEIHLSAALNRLAKMNLTVATGLPRQHQQELQTLEPFSEVRARHLPGNYGLQGNSLPISSPPDASSLIPGRRDMYAFPPPASTPLPGTPTLSRIGLSQSLILTKLPSHGCTLSAQQAPSTGPWMGIGPPPLDLKLRNAGHRVPISASGPLHSPEAEPAGAMRVGAQQQQHAALQSGTLTATSIALAAQSARGPVPARPAASPEELCVELLEALACRGGGAPIGHASSAPAENTLEENQTADCNGRCGTGAGTGHGKSVSPYRVATCGGRTGFANLAAVATPSPPSPLPLTARVVANATWSAARLVMQLWPRHPSSATEEAALPPPWRARSDVSGSRVANAGFESQGLSQDSATRPGWVVGSKASPTLQRRSCAALRALLALMVDSAPFMEPQHLSNMLYTVARLAARLPEVLESPGGGDSDSSDRESSSHRGSAHAVETPQVTAADAAGVLRGGHLALRLMEVLLDASLPKLSSFGPQALSNSLYAVACVNIPPPQSWLRAWLNVSAGKLLRADPQHIANILWALARLGYDPGDPWIMTALQASTLKAPAFTTQGLCNTLWALAKMGFTADSAVKVRALLPLASALGSAARECDGQDVANGMWSIARLHMRIQPFQPPVWGTGGSGSQEGSAALSLTISSSPESTKERSLAEARDVLQAAGRKLLRASSRHLNTYNSQQLANTCWATAALGLQPPPDWEPQFWPAALAALPAMRTEELVATAMASARIQLQPPDQWLEAVFKLTSQAMLPQSSLPQQLSAVEGVAFGGAGGLPLRSQTRIQATARALASILWCVSTWGVRVPVAWTAAVLGQLEAQAGDRTLEPAALATALQAMARMGLNADAIIAGWTARVVESVVVSAAANVNASTADRKTADLVTRIKVCCELTAGTEGVDADAHLKHGGSNGAKGAPNGQEVLGGARLAVEAAKMRQRLFGGDCVTKEVDDLDGRCARMILWSLARLRCQMSDQVAGRLALKALESDTMMLAPAVKAETVQFPEASEEQAEAEAGQGAGNRRRRRGLFRASRGAELGAGGTDEARCLQESERIGARNVCVVLWALASTSSRPSPDVMRQLTLRAAMEMKSASDSELLTIVRSFAALGFRPGARFRRAAEDRIVRLAPSLTREQVAAVSIWCARLQWRLSKDVCEVLRDVAL